MEKIKDVAKAAKAVPADIKDFQTVFAYLGKEGYYQETKKGVQCGVSCGWCES